MAEQRREARADLRWGEAVSERVVAVVVVVWAELRGGNDLGAPRLVFSASQAFLFAAGTAAILAAFDGLCAAGPIHRCRPPRGWVCNVSARLKESPFGRNLDPIKSFDSAKRSD